MKKQLSKLMRSAAMLVTLALLLTTLASTVLAASPTITINKGNDVKSDWTGMKVSAYQVFEQSNTNANARLYTVHEDFKDFFNTEVVKAAFDGTKQVYLGYDATQNKLVVSTTAKEGYFQVANNAALDAVYAEADLIERIGTGDNIATFYSWIEKYIEAKVTAGTMTQTPAEATATAANSISLPVAEEGYYALTFSGVPTGISVKQGILISTAEPTITVKAEEIPLEKTVKNPDNAADYAKNATADMGDELEYKITSKVPTLVDYSNLTNFVFTDTLKNQKIADNTSFALQIQDAVVTKEGDTFKIGDDVVATLSLGTYANGEQAFTLTFDTAVLENHQGKTITLTYQAVLTADAIQINDNTVKLDYTNGPDDITDTDNTEVYTYGVKVQKTFSDASTTANYGAVKFALYTDTGYNNGQGGTALTLYGSNGVYKVTGEPTGTTELVLNSTDGTLSVAGLDAGTYWLVETATANGFNVANPIKIVLTAKATPNEEQLDSTATTAAYVDAEGEKKIDDVTVVAQDTTNINLASFDVLNQKGFNLPQTGGAGTWMFTIGGIALIGVALVLFACSRKNKCK